MTELVPGLLWVGGLESVLPLSDRYVKVITVLHVNVELGGAVVHCWLPATNDEVLTPLQIEAAVAGRVRTLVHCQLGQNRSTAIAICWLRRNFHVAGDVKLGKLADTIDWVIAERTRDLESIGRHGAELSPAMKKNVSDYEVWLRNRGS